MRLAMAHSISWALSHPDQKHWSQWRPGSGRASCWQPFTTHECSTGVQWPHDLFLFLTCPHAWIHDFVKVPSHLCGVMDSWVWYWDRGPPWPLCSRFCKVKQFTVPVIGFGFSSMFQYEEDVLCLLRCEWGCNRRARGIKSSLATVAGFSATHISEWLLHLKRTTSLTIESSSILTYP